MSDSSTPKASRERCEKVFVYGTLRRGQRYRHLIDSFVVRQEIGTIRGSMFHYSPDTPGGDGEFPYVQPGDGSIRGEVLSFRDFALALEILDEIEDHPKLYVREIVDVVYDNGDKDRAIVYLIAAGHAAAGRAIPSGDWLDQG